MKHKSRIAIGTVGLAAAFLLASSVSLHSTAKAPAAPRICPMCDLKREVEVVSLLKPQADCTVDVPRNQ